jgi:ComF family protein
VDELICAGAFQGPLRTAIHNFKYESDTPLASALALLLAQALVSGEKAGLDSEPPSVIPVPLHIDRKRQRGYNQSELLARELAKITGWPLVRGLERVRNTRSQVGLTAEERRENMRDAFAWRGGAVPRRVLLVDDVCTTGATLSACADVLRANGARGVYAAAVGRALGAGPSAGS